MISITTRVTFECDHLPGICLCQPHVIAAETTFDAFNIARREGWYICGKNALCPKHAIRTHGGTSCGLSLAPGVTACAGRGVMARDEIYSTHDGDIRDPAVWQRQDLHRVNPMTDSNRKWFMPQAHQETVQEIAEVLCRRFDASSLDSVDAHRQERYEGAAEAVLQRLYALAVLPRLPRS